MSQSITDWIGPSILRYSAQHGDDLSHALSSHGLVQVIKFESFRQPGDATDDTIIQAIVSDRVHRIRVIFDPARATEIEALTKEPTTSYLRCVLSLNTYRFSFRPVVSLPTAPTTANPLEDIAFVLEVDDWAYQTGSRHEPEFYERSRLVDGGENAGVTTELRLVLNRWAAQYRAKNATQLTGQTSSQPQPSTMATHSSPLRDCDGNLPQTSAAPAVRIFQDPMKVYEQLIPIMQSTGKASGGADTDLVAWAFKPAGGEQGQKDHEAIISAIQTWGLDADVEDEDNEDGSDASDDGVAKEDCRVQNSPDWPSSDEREVSPPSSPAPETTSTRRQEEQLDQSSPSSSPPETQESAAPEKGAATTSAPSQTRRADDDKRGRFSAGPDDAPSDVQDGPAPAISTVKIKPPVETADDTDMDTSLPESRPDQPSLFSDTSPERKLVSASPRQPDSPCRRERSRSQPSPRVADFSPAPAEDLAGGMVSRRTPSHSGRTDTRLARPVDKEIAASGSVILAVDSDEAAQSQSQTQSELSQQAAPRIIETKLEHHEPPKRRGSIDQTDEETSRTAKRARLPKVSVKAEPAPLITPAEPVTGKATSSSPDTKPAQLPRVDFSRTKAYLAEQRRRRGSRAFTPVLFGGSTKDTKDFALDALAAVPAAIGREEVKPLKVNQPTQEMMQTPVQDTKLAEPAPAGLTSVAVVGINLEYDSDYSVPSAIVQQILETKKRMKQRKLARQSRRSS